MGEKVIVRFKAGEGKIQELEQTLRAALPETRAFDGCNSLETLFDPQTSTFTLLEDWESYDHYDRYLGWRSETGLADTLGPLLDGGMAGFSVERLQLTDI